MQHGARAPAARGAADQARCRTHYRVGGRCSFVWSLFFSGSDWVNTGCSLDCAYWNVPAFLILQSLFWSVWFVACWACCREEQLTKRVAEHTAELEVRAVRSTLCDAC